MKLLNYYIHKKTCKLKSLNSRCVITKTIKSYYCKFIRENDLKVNKKFLQVRTPSLHNTPYLLENQAFQQFCLI